MSLIRLRSICGRTCMRKRMTCPLSLWQVLSVGASSHASVAVARFLRIHPTAPHQGLHRVRRLCDLLTMMLLRQWPLLAAWPPLRAVPDQGGRYVSVSCFTRCVWLWMTYPRLFLFLCSRVYVQWFAGSGSVMPGFPAGFHVSPMCPVSGLCCGALALGISPTTTRWGR